MAKSTRKRAPAKPTPRPAPRPKVAAPKPATRAARPQRTIPVHVLADERVHLALPHLGRLRQGRLKTLCGKLAVSELTPFALAGPKSARCRACFGKVDAEGQVPG